MRKILFAVLLILFSGAKIGAQSIYYLELLTYPNDTVKLNINCLFPDCNINFPPELWGQDLYQDSDTLKLKLYYHRPDALGTQFVGTIDTIDLGEIIPNGSIDYLKIYPFSIDTVVFDTVGFYKDTVLAFPWTTSVNGVNTLPESFTVYPNPASDYLYIETTKSEFIKADVVITDVTGRVVVSEKNVVFDNQRHTINTASLINGIYFIKLTDNKGQILSMKFVKL